MVTIAKAKEVSDYLVSKIDPVAIILFGSVARRNQGTDLDLLIVTKDEGKKHREVEKEVCRYLKPFYKNFSIDPFVVSATLLKKHFFKGSPFLRLIQREGRSLYVKESFNQWLKQAQEELNTADYLLGGEFYRGVCYHSQQAIEKSLKALLINKGWELEKTHSIERLIAIMEEYNIPISIPDDDVVFIDSVYRGRYPAEEGLLPLGEVTRDDAQKAIKIAKEISEMFRTFAG